MADSPERTPPLARWRTPARIGAMVVPFVACDPVDSPGQHHGRHRCPGPRPGVVSAAATGDRLAGLLAAQSLFEEYVVGLALLDWLEVARTDAVTPLMFEQRLIDRAVSDRRHVRLPEGEDERILRAGDILLRRVVANLTLLGDPGTINARAASIGVDLADARLQSPFDEAAAMTRNNVSTGF